MSSHSPNLVGLPPGLGLCLSSLHPQHVSESLHTVGVVVCVFKEES